MDWTRPPPPISSTNRSRAIILRLDDRPNISDPRTHVSWSPVKRLNWIFAEYLLKRADKNFSRSHGTDYAHMSCYYIPPTPPCTMYIKVFDVWIKLFPFLLSRICFCSLVCVSDAGFVNRSRIPFSTNTNKSTHWTLQTDLFVSKLLKYFRKYSDIYKPIYYGWILSLHINTYG